MGKRRIALVEDDPDIAESIRYNLVRTGLYEVDCFPLGQPMLDSAGEKRFDLVLLDLNLPDVDGLALCRELRAFEATRRVPIVMLTARVSERDRVRGLNVGADDYVTKPFSMPELLARVAVHLRRVALDEPAGGERFDDGKLVVDAWARLVSLGGKEVRLTKKELDLLWLLVSSRPRVLSREMILAKLWDWSSEVDLRTIDVHVRSLRKKIGEEYIETSIGVGYRFRPREKSGEAPP